MGFGTRIVRSKWFPVVLAGVGVLSLVLVFGFAPTTMYGVSIPGNLLAYWHISLAWTAGLALFVTFLGSIQFVRTNRRWWNLFAAASGEIGFLMLTATMIMGSIWGSIIWGVYWSWGDVRMVTLFIAWFVYAGYLVIFQSTKHAEGRYAAIYGILGFVSIPLSFVSVRLWQPELHNPTLGNAGSTGSVIDPATLLVSILSVMLLYAFLVSVRVQIHELEDSILAKTAQN